MKKTLILAALIGWAVTYGSAAGVTGSFIQLNRAAAKKGLVDWHADIMQMKKAGITTLIIQWCADDDIAYVKDDALLSQREQFDTVRIILEATRSESMDVYLGLQADTHYWTRIRATDRVLRDYFLARTAENERLQQALLKHFSGFAQWKGYYIPDEIDDLTWRNPDRTGLLTNYLRTLVGRIRENDRDREVMISAFFRSRTAPHVFAKTLRRVTADAGLDHVLIQDGIGVGNPPQKYVPIYYQALQETWRGADSTLWLVVESFAQTSADHEPFTAEPAAPERLAKQIRDGANYFESLVMFTFLDYVDPDLGARQKALYQVLGN